MGLSRLPRTLPHLWTRIVSGSESSNPLITQATAVGGIKEIISLYLESSSIFVLKIGVAFTDRINLHLK